MKSPSIETPSPAPPATARRRVPGWLVAAACAGAAVVYGLVLEKMSFGPPLVMLGLGGMTLALCGMALWRVIDPLTRPDGVAAMPARAPQRLRELEREKQAVLKAIKEIEIDHQMRKIADGDYREMIERYRTRAMRLISEIEAGDNFRPLIERELKDRLASLLASPATVAATAASAITAAASAAEPEPVAASAEATTETSGAPVAHRCSACQTINDDDARFCKKCGAQLEPR
jgi:hypothetical protein